MKSVHDVMLRDPSQIVRRPAVSHPAPQDQLDLAAGDDQPPLWLTRQEIADLGYVRMTNHAGLRVWVAPLFWMDGEPVYPPVNLPPGLDRMAAEAAMNARYRAYREQRATVPGPRRRHERLRSYDQTVGPAEPVSGGAHA